MASSAQMKLDAESLRDERNFVDVVAAVLRKLGLPADPSARIRRRARFPSVENQVEAQPGTILNLKALEKQYPKAAMYMWHLGEGPEYPMWSEDTALAWRQGPPCAPLHDVTFPLVDGLSAFAGEEYPEACALAAIAMAVLDGNGSAVAS